MNPSDKDALLKAAQDAHSAGRLDESESLFRQVVQIDPSDIDAKMFLGIVLAKKNSTADAISLLNETIEARQDAFQALFWLSVLYRRSGNVDVAATFARRAADIQPQNAMVLNNLGVCEMESGDLPAAQSSFEGASALQPRDPSLLYNLATCLGYQGSDDAALAVLRRANALAPNSPDIRVLASKTLLNLTRTKEAIVESEAAIRLNSGSAAAHQALALALVHDGQTDRARSYAQNAVDLEPSGANYAALGTVLQSAGQMADSNEAFVRSIELEPNQGHAYFSLVHNRRTQDSDRPLLRKMEELATAGKLQPKELASLEYGLGKGYEDLGEYEKAILHYDAANRLARKLKYGDEPFDIDRAVASTDVKIERYTAHFLRASSRQGSVSDAPIFVLGMMRSGTTLVEHILSAHPDVAAGGELSFWLDRGLESISATGEVHLSKLEKLAGQYLALLKGLAHGKPRVTDKMPANYLVLGLIHAALPDARVIHVQRNPADTAISIYATPNRARIDFAHDKVSIVRAYVEYLRLMEHWRAVIPGDRLYEVRYEELVQDPEPITRQIAEFSGLTWNDAMLSPQSNRRSVVTPSSWQVRQPVYKSSVDRWRKFEPWLGPFRELVELA